MTLTTDHARPPTIRLATPSDAPQIAAIYAPYCEANAVSFEDVAPSAEEMATRINVVGANRPWLVLDDGGVVAGYAYAGPHHERAAYRWAVSTAVYVSSAHRRRGAGRALYTTMFELLRLLGYFKATAGVALPNPASVALHEAVGFALVGVYRQIGYKLGAWHDVAWYEADLQPSVSNPAEPRPLSILAGAGQWDSAVARGVAQYVQHP
jgi:phosphinothricin acetyltransferase